MSFFKDHRRWGAEEDKLLRNAYPVSGIDGARVALPHRSKSSVVARAKRLGLSRSGTGKMKEWTGLDEIRLKRMWSNSPKSGIAAILPNRSWRAITSKARKLGLFRNVNARWPIPEVNNHILAKIRTRMTDNGFTATDLEVVANLKRGTTRNWFRGSAQPKLRNVEKAIIALDGEFTIKWREPE